MIQAIGSPVKDGFMFTGQINLYNDTGNARLSFPISGPKGTGTVFAKTELEYGQWRYYVLVVMINGRSERIDISDNSSRKRADEKVLEVEARDSSRDAVKGVR